MARDVGAVVPAAGRGKRLGSREAKALVPLAGKPLVFHTLQALQDVPAIRWIVVVVRPEDRARVLKLVRHHRLTKVSAVVSGAASRAESVARGIAALPAQARWVVIHDGARPCVTSRLIGQVLLKAKRHGAVACGLPVSQTVKAVDEEQQVRLTLDRDSLWLVQTPQAFRRDWLSDALVRVNPAPLVSRPRGAKSPVSSSATKYPSRALSQRGGVNHAFDQLSDDAALLEWVGFPVRMIPGDPLNIKVTTREDLMLAEAILRSRLQKSEVR